jgi:hypothetical protein
MVRRNTWILLFVLAGLVGFSFYLRNFKTRQAAAATPTSGSVSLFSSTDGSPNGIKIVDSIGVSVEVARDQSGAWVVRAPTQAAANQASAEAAATQIGALRVLASVELGPDIVGLDKPAYTLTITFAAGKTRQLVVGSVTPIQDGYYTQLDGGPINVVDKVGLDALLSLLTSPPYLATLTPVATVTPSPEPATATPEATLTPLGSPGGATATATP